MRYETAHALNNNQMSEVQFYKWRLSTDADDVRLDGNLVKKN